MPPGESQFFYARGAISEMLARQADGSSGEWALCEAYPESIDEGRGPALVLKFWLDYDDRQRPYVVMDTIRAWTNQSGE